MKRKYLENSNWPPKYVYYVKIRVGNTPKIQKQIVVGIMRDNDDDGNVI